MAVYTWSVTAEEVQTMIGTSVASLSAETEATVDQHIKSASGRVNALVHDLASADPETLAAGTSQVAQSVTAMIQDFIRHRAAAMWLRPRNPSTASDYAEDARQILVDLRYRLPEARAALSVEAGPDLEELAGGTTPTTYEPWVDPEEAFN